MPKENCQKIKLLKIMEILRHETDEDHPLKTSDICQRLVEMNISCDPRTLHRDMKLLNEYGYEIMSLLDKHELAYYIADRSFSVPEIKILIDAVQAASFITDSKTAVLVDKIAALGGCNRAEVLKKNIVLFNTRKHRNESILYNVDALEQAIGDNKKVIFRYFDMGVTGQREFRREGHHYVVEPVAMVFSEDNYYLITYSSRHKNTANYRVDRMVNIEVIEEDISDEAKELRSKVAGYTESVFRMYGGQTVDVTLQFDKKLIGSIYDKFGETLSVRKIDENNCAATVAAQISPTFWGWLFQFEGKMTILFPQKLQEEYLKKVDALKKEHNPIES